MNNISWCLLMLMQSAMLLAYNNELKDLPNFYIPTDAPSAERNENTLNCQNISETTVNGKHVCRGEIIFKDNFDYINTDIWKYDVRIPTEPDYEFVTYVKSHANAYVDNGILHLKPTVMNSAGENGIGNLQLEGCTASVHGGECSRSSTSFLVLPPVFAARIRTRESFSFRYGEVKIRAKMPKGDWIYPIIWLEPKDSEYGWWYMSGRIIIALSRGNEKLGTQQSLNYGESALYRGCMYWPDNSETSPRSFMPFIKRGIRWSDDFHTFTVKWTPEELTFRVDGQGKTSCRLPNTVFFGRETIWSRGSNMAPFDKEFYVTLGIAVGGIREFPDNYIGTNNHTKPWKNNGAKALLNFWKDKQNWKRTWHSPNSSLQIDSIEINAL